MAKEKEGELSENKLESLSFEDFKNFMNNAAGKTLVYSPNDQEDLFVVPRLPTGILALDFVLYGGFPYGKNIQLLGPPSTGKSYIMYSIMKRITNLPESQHNKVLLEDAENSFDSAWARAIGVNLSNVQVVRGSTAEEAMNHIRAALQCGAFGGVFLDSVPALTPKAKAESSSEKAHMAIGARLFSEQYPNINFSKSICYTNHKYMPMFVYANQFREKVGIMFGNPQIPSGGNAIKFYTDVTIETKKIEDIIVNDLAIGRKIGVHITKNKTAPAWGKSDFDIITFGESKGSVDNWEPLLDLLTKGSIVQKAGSWYSWEGNKLGQGSKKASGALKDFTNEQLNGFLNEALKNMGYPEFAQVFPFKEDKDGSEQSISRENDKGEVAETGEESSKTE